MGGVYRRPSPLAPGWAVKLDKALTRSIAATKRRLVKGGLLQPIEWGVPGEPDVRGRRTYAYTPLDALIEERPALDRGRVYSERARRYGTDDSRARGDY